MNGCSEVPTAVPIPQRLAVIGDFASDTVDEQRVADLVRAFRPDQVLSVGDNDYSSEFGHMRSRATYDRYVRKYYGDWLADEPTKNRFWPSPGNHDWYSPVSLAPYLDYFKAVPREPAQGRYYSIAVGSAGVIDIFSIDSDDHEPDGRTATSKQATWLQGALAASVACWKLVFFHHPPYSSGKPNTYFVQEMRWPFAAWGADAVLSGHEHFYERSEVDGRPYFISGLGGYSKFGFLTNPPPPESRMRFNEDFGALLLTVGTDTLTFEFMRIGGRVVDSLVLQKTCPR